jgi:hypothetical protein
MFSCDLLLGLGGEAIFGFDAEACEIAALFFGFVEFGVGGALGRVDGWVGAVGVGAGLVDCGLRNADGLPKPF